MKNMDDLNYPVPDSVCDYAAISQRLLIVKRECEYLLEYISEAQYPDVFTDSAIKCRLDVIEQKLNFTRRLLGE